MTLKVLLADDQALVRAGFRSLLERTEGVEVVAEAADGQQAVELCRKHRPDVVLMDIRMPVMDGLEAARRILSDSELQDSKVIVLTTFGLDEYLFEALRLGASGFLLKDIEPADLRGAIWAAHRGDALLSPSMTRRLIDRFAGFGTGRAAESGKLDLLTTRERQIVGLVGLGLSNDEIAERLVVSPATAKTHVSRSMVKLGARDRAQLVVFAYEAGLVPSGRAVPPTE